MSNIEKQPIKSGNVRLLPTQHVFNTQIHRRVINQSKHIHINRLLILGLITSQLILAAWNIYTINLINENKLNQQIINEELIPMTPTQLKLISASELA